MQQQALIADVAAVLGIPTAQTAGMVLEPCNAGGNNRRLPSVIDEYVNTGRSGNVQYRGARIGRAAVDDVRRAHLTR